MGILLGIALLFLALGVGAVWLFRRSKADQAAAAVALEALAKTLNAQPASRPLTGTFKGRACTISRFATYGSEGTSPHIRVHLALRTATTFELYPQRSGLGARLVNDVEVGDPEFDRWFIVRTNDRDKVARALAPDIRRTLIDWQRGGWFERAWVRDDQLTYEVGCGLDSAANVERVPAILDVLARIAMALE